MKPIRELLEILIQEVPSGAAAITHGVDESGNKYLKVSPRNPRAASIRALDDDGEYVLALGRGTVVELTAKPRAEEEVLEICRGVAGGHFLERVPLFFGEKLFTYGCINIPGHPVRSFSGLPIIPLWKTLRYEPYS